MSGQIQDVEFIGLRSALQPPARFSWGSADQRNVGLVRVTTTDGVVGWGETSVTFPLWSLEERAHTVRALAPLLTGSSCGDLDEISATVDALAAATARLRLLWSPVALSASIGAIEMALVDALARSRGVPAWRLFGGTPDPVALYAVGFAGDLSAQVDQARSALDEGYAAVKVRVGFGEQADLELVRAFRTGLGDGAELLADANMGWDRRAAATMASHLEPYRLGWLEEPLSRDDPAGMRIAGDLAGTRVAAGENAWSGAELDSLVESGHVDVLMPDLARCGGLLQGLAGARRALELGRTYSPHHYASDVGFCAALTLCAVVGPSEPLLRDISTWPLRSDVLSEPVKVIAGRALLPEVAGLSPEPDPVVVERNRVL